MDSRQGHEGTPAPEFSRVVNLDKLEPEGSTCEIEASADERAKLAARFGLQSLDRLSATVTLQPSPNGEVVRAEGRLRADLEQVCVVTLDAVPVHLDEPFSLRVTANPLLVGADRAEMEVDPERDGPPELAPDGKLDIGETVAQELALALNPYPRAPDVQEEPLVAADRQQEPSPSPFAKLAGLHKPQQ